jgi:hypothetical protein
VLHRTALGVLLRRALVVNSFFDDWKRFCFVFSEIASGDNRRPLSALEARKRAKEVLIECGYPWPGCTAASEPIGGPDIPSEAENEVKKLPDEQARHSLASHPSKSCKLSRLEITNWVESTYIITGIRRWATDGRS